MLRLLAISLAIYGCTSAQYADEVAPSSSLDDTDEPRDEDHRSADPPWSRAEVEAQLNAALSQAWPSPVTIRDTYLAAMSNGDGACPGSTVELTDPITAMQGCTAASGWSYQGHSTYSESGTIGEDNTASWWISADFEIQNPDGQALIGGGGVMLNYRQLTSGGSEYVVELYGTWADEAQSGWLGQGISAVLTTQATGTPTDHQIALDGGITFLSHSLHFRDLTLGAEDCPGPAGTLGIHDGISSWYWLALSCDPCGELTHGTTELGEVCLSIDELPQSIFDAVSQP